MDEEAAPVIVDVVDVLDPPVLVNEMDLALTWIGFDNVAMRKRIQVEGFSSFDDLRSTKERDVSDLAESYGRRTVVDGRFIFGVRHIQYHIGGMLHWRVQDFVSSGEVPSLNDLVSSEYLCPTLFVKLNI